MSDDLKRLKRELREKERMLAQVMQAGEIRAAFVDQPDDSTALKRATNFTLDPVFRYLSELKAYPREALEAKFRQVFEETAPESCGRLWLVEALARRFQHLYYVEHLGAVPASVAVNDANFERSAPWPMTLEEREGQELDDADQVVSADARLLPAAEEPPFSRGRGRTAFDLVRAAAEAGGIKFATLARALAELLELTKDESEKRARRMFTKWVRRGWTRIEYV